jgi:competence protein ComEC
VGQGDAILIQTPGNKNILIDGGPSPQAIKMELSKKLPFWNHTIDLMIITQPQADHITGLAEVMQCYTVKEVMDPCLAYDSKIYTQLLTMIREKGLKYQVIHGEQAIEVENHLTIDILYPPQFIQVNQNTINDNSLALRLNYKNRHFLLAGDISKSTEYYLISQRVVLRSDILKVAHHGSRTSTTPEFLQSVHMQAAVISAGENNNFGHPHPETINHIMEQIDKDNLFVTYKCGTVEFISDGDKLWVKTGN